MLSLPNCFHHKIRGQEKCFILLLFIFFALVNVEEECGERRYLRLLIRRDPFHLVGKFVSLVGSPPS